MSGKLDRDLVIAAIRVPLTQNIESDSNGKYISGLAKLLFVIVSGS